MRWFSCKSNGRHQSRRVNDKLTFRTFMNQALIRESGRNACRYRINFTSNLILPHCTHLLFHFFHPLIHSLRHAPHSETCKTRYNSIVISDRSEHSLLNLDVTLLYYSYKQCNHLSNGCFSFFRTLVWIKIAIHNAGFYTLK